MSTLNDIINYRISRARESIEEAEIMIDNEHWTTSINRQYYACFYSIIAFLAFKNEKSTTHSGVKALFNKHIGKTENISTELTKHFNNLFNYRLAGDYADLVEYEKETVIELFPVTRKFVETVISLIE